ncbi:MAG: DNA polymerase III subunit alpha, partial [Eubacteriales bacterium]
MFCNLHVHNEYSLLDGVGKAEEWCKRAKELEQTHLALTNHGNIDGLLNFQSVAKKAGIKPIMGCELYVVPDILDKKNKSRQHLTVLVKNEAGFQNLCKMLSIANLQGFYYKPRVDYSIILKNCDGLVFLSGCAASPIYTPQGEKFFWKLHRKIKDDLYFEIMPHQILRQIDVNRKAMVAAAELGAKVVVTNDCHYVNYKDAMLQEVLLAVQMKAKWNDKNRWKFETTGLHLRSEEEMLHAFHEQSVIPKEFLLKAIDNTMEVAVKCESFEIKKKEIFLPPVAGVPTKKEGSQLRKLCFDGYRKIFGTDDWDERYLARFQEEFLLIKKKNFIRYFLIVHELISWCSDNNIMTGPGRGSVGGSLIAYLIGITKSVDPIKYDLLFSRFIDENRLDYPDIDIDFEDTKRALIREHLEELYGKNNIASVSTFSKMKGKGVIRDVSRVFDVPLDEVNKFAKVIEDPADKKDTDCVLRALKETPEGLAFNEKYPKVADLACSLEGQIRSCGQHAAALIVSEEDLTQGTRCNISIRSGQEVVNFDKDDAEFVGLMKLDILGLVQLSILNETRRLIKQNYGKEIDFEKLEPNDKKIFKMLSNGETVGVFQFNTWATTKLAKRIIIDNFGLMSDVVALVRPGPSDSGMTDDFIKRKHGAKWKKKHPIYEDITKSTYGIVIYQEQVMQVIYRVAGLSYSTSDKIRKIISKKRDQSMFDEYKTMFIEGCKKQKTLSEIEANEFWEALQSHSRYSFNRSHSVSYALISYWCVDGTTRLYDWDNKKYISISKAFKTGIKNIACYDEKTKKTVCGKVKKIIRTTGAKNVDLKMGYKVRMKSGKTICCSKDHKFLTSNGYVALKDLNCGDLVAVEKRISNSSKPGVGEKISFSLKKHWMNLSSDERKKRLGFCSAGGKEAARIGVMKKRWKTMSPDERERRLLPWIEAAAKSENGFKSRFVGNAKDGHMVFSKNEYVLDNWLFENNLKHETQVQINGKFADFYCKGVYIEFDGMNRPEKYFEDKFGEEPLVVITNINQIENKLHFLLEEDFMRSGEKIIFEPIKKISKWKKRVMYDVVMEKEPHNFLANGIVVHNCAYLKLYYPAEFICANLTFGAEGKKVELVEEAERLGLNIVFPKIGISDAFKWVVKDKDLFVPFIEIKGVGDKTAEKFAAYRTPTKKGFFTLSPVPVSNDEGAGKILAEIGAFGEKPTGK